MSLDDTIKAPADGAAPAVNRKLGLALLVIATAQLMLVLDDTIVNVALPSMQRSLHIPASHLNWVASFYALTSAGCCSPAAVPATSSGACACSA
jgi:MFS family permease